MMLPNKLFLSLFLLLPILAHGSCPSWLDHEVKKLHSADTFQLCDVVSNKTVLLVNTASHCGFTKQFKGLEALYQKYKDQGFVIVGFPSDSFFQEADSEAETASVCYQNYGVTFPMSQTVAVKGKSAHPVFVHLGEQKGYPKWNFFKYLIDQKGNVVERFGSRTKPLDSELEESIASLLKVE